MRYVVVDLHPFWITIIGILSNICVYSKSAMTSFGPLRIEYGFEPTLDCCFSPELTEEEFYDSSQTPSVSACNVTTPGKDIWNKFDIEEFEENSLYPTPPLSPERIDPIDSGGGKEATFDQSYGEKLSQVLASLEDEPIWMTQTFNFTAENLLSVSSKTTDSSSSSKLKQDCMWSTWKRLLQGQETKSSVTKHTDLPKDSKNSIIHCVQSSDPQTECVDPATVFPYPLSETKLDLKLDFGGPSTPSDSEEEVDVVTVAREDKKAHEVFRERLQPKVVKEIRGHQYSYHKMSSTPPHDYAKPKPKHTRVIIRNSKRSHDGSSNSHLSNKRRKHGNKVDLEALKKALQKLDDDSKPVVLACRKSNSRLNSRGSSQQSSHPSSDSEDSERRVNHNVLERKRRDDLRHAFFKLRDQVPDLQTQDRAAKVVILKKAQEYVQKLRTDESEKAYHKRMLEDEHRRLIRKLNRLKEQLNVVY